MKLPNFERALIDRRKFDEYCLNPLHPRGKHKAKVFQVALGIAQEETDELIEEINRGIGINECTVGESDKYGQRYAVDFTWERSGKQVKIRTSWIIKSKEDYPRLTSCYVM